MIDPSVTLFLRYHFKLKSILVSYYMKPLEPKEHTAH